MCATTEVSDAIRIQFLDTHNVRRNVLATGQMTDAYGPMALPTASNMLKLRWDCALEKEAIDYINTCPMSTYAKKNDQESGENFFRSPMSSYPAPRDAVKKAITEWWKVYRMYSTPGTNAMFLSAHLNSPVASYTMMGWAINQYLGCAIGICGTDYVAVCRYNRMRPNTINYPQYTVGAPCSACPAGTSCISGMGLCN
ncbi:SCP-like protein [Oesophagostomum dentatum]|uniref:SCP-like protein n=1 Tax=Oesophagostomum dentatum TaxID=61180 RepID=A0A0B1TJW5_OESDE|nr:SCP-like protein [Oesophagostomum dentatum]